MRVLDIDLDFFLADCCELAPLGERPNVIGHEPWQAAAVRAFLENNCGLSRCKKVPGRIFMTHDGALRFWGELLESGRLGVPFEVTHIDAHSDLGIGKPGPGFVLNSVLPISPSERADIARYYEMKQLDEANYLLFALAFRWVSKLENVRNPNSRPDIPQFAYRSAPNDTGGGEYESIQLSSFVSKLFEAKNGAEPRIGFRVYDDYKSFSAKDGYDFASLAISPRYLPAEADALADVIAEYFDLI